MNNADAQYLGLCRHILENGVEKSDRTGTGTLSTFGYQMRFDLAAGFPLLTTKKVAWKSVVHELLWFLRGEGNGHYLEDNGVKIWREWYRDNYDLGPIYPVQWRNWLTYEDDGTGYASPSDPVDQIAQVIEQIRTNPDSRRLLVNAWNVGELHEMALPPCHFAFQFYVADGRLSCQLYQRSGDVFLGVPFNIASYSLLTLMIAHVTGLKPGEFVHTIGDAHIYSNHIAQVKTQLERTPRALPTVSITKDTDDIDAITADDIVLTGYDPHPKLTGKVAV